MIRNVSLLSSVALLAVAVACGGGSGGEMASADSDGDMAETAPGPLRTLILLDQGSPRDFSSEVCCG